MVLLPFFFTFPNVSLSIKTNVTATSIAESQLKSFYLRLGFKFIKYFATSPNFEEAHKQFHYESVKSKAFQKQRIGLKYYPTIPRIVTIFHDNLIDFD